MSGHTPLPSIQGIILTGFMGAGKTTAGALLADRLGWRFIDSDHLVELQAHLTVAEIFEQHGETVFRNLEADAIRSATQSEQIVLALGGGALERCATRAHLASLTGWRTVFLDAPFDTLIARCAGQPHAPVRPVLRDRDRLAERWNLRLPAYRQAYLTVVTEDRTSDAVVDLILAGLSVDPEVRHAAQSAGAAPPAASRQGGAA
jgi:shikimate kinase